VYYLSYGSDMRRFAPRSFLTGMAWNWAPIMTDVVRSVRDRSWDQHPGRMWWHGLDKAGVDLIPFSERVPEEVRQRVMERKRDIIEGRFQVFPGQSDDALLALASLDPNVVSEAPRLLEYDHPETRELVSFVMEAADALRREGEAVFPAFRHPGGRWFQGERYVFVWDLQGNRYVYPPDPAHELGNMAKLEDIDGKPIGRMFIEAASSPSGEGWIHYQWYPPGDPKPIWKSTYVVRVEPPSGKSYLIGSGTYGLPPERAFVSRVVDQAAALLKREGKAGFATLRNKSGPFFFHDTYVFVDTMDGVELVNPAFPALEGQSLIDIRDAKGKMLVRDYIAEASRHGAAWVSYYWPRTGSREPVLKQSYVRKVRVGDQDLIVGAGLYEKQ
ncbi:MAG TPA: hypothetical protein ENO16_02630, partial [Chromatiales bacterium]|nr:hypothetical protein [Chromatiales bacterium]